MVFYFVRMIIFSSNCDCSSRFTVHATMHITFEDTIPYFIVFLVNAEPEARLHLSTKVLKAGRYE